MSNTRIWDAVGRTDPAHTKAVSKGAFKFTAIDAYSQVKAATEFFGPVGERWGWKVGNIQVATIDEESCVIVPIKFWWYEPGTDTTQPGEFVRETIAPNEYSAIGCCAVRQYVGRGENRYLKLDDEAPKKALTDAITKALSWLGFNADVFEGKFDDSKYVQARQADAAHEHADRAFAKLKEMIAGAGTEAELEQVKRASRPMAAELLPEQVAQVPGMFEARLSEIVINDDIPM